MIYCAKHIPVLKDNEREFFSGQGFLVSWGSCGRGAALSSVTCRPGRTWSSASRPQSPAVHAVVCFLFLHLNTNLICHPVNQVKNQRGCLQWPGRWHCRPPWELLCAACVPSALVPGALPRPADQSVRTEISSWLICSFLHRPLLSPNQI